MIHLHLVYGGKTQSVDLKDGEHTVGRSPDCKIHLPVRTVSREHALLRVEGDKLFVKDLGSANGSQLDGDDVKSDEVEVSLTSILTFAEVRATRQPPSLVSTPTPAMLSEVHEVRPELSYRSDQGFSEAARARIITMLASLFELVASDAKSQDVGTAACEFLAKWVDADRVVLLEDSGEGTPIEPEAQWLRQAVDPDQRLHLSNTILDQVLTRRESVLVADAAHDPATAGHASVVALQLRSAMAAPLFDNQRVRGVLYVDTSRIAVRYTAEDLQVLSAVANAVAVKLRNVSLEKEMKMAERIQMGMLPQELPAIDGFQLETHQVMCRDVGGDLYECLPRAENRVMLALGDVAGKGIPAALCMGAATVAIRMLSEMGSGLDQLTPLLHRHLLQAFAAEQFITLFLGELDTSTGKMSYVNAGHEPPRLIRADGSMEQLPSNAPPMALIPMFEPKMAQVELGPGDLLAVFSDGITEATQDGENFLGHEEMEQILREDRTKPLADVSEKIIGLVNDYVGPQGASDDVTLMLLRRG